MVTEVPGGGIRYSGIDGFMLIEPDLGPIGSVGHGGVRLSARLHLRLRKVGFGTSSRITWAPGRRPRARRRQLSPSGGGLPVFNLVWGV